VAVLIDRPDGRDPRAIGSSWPRLRGLLGLAVLALVLAWVATARAAAGPSEDELEAAYLFNFARYVEWPEEAFAGPEAPIRVCVLGGGSFLEVARANIADRSVNERKVLVEPRSSADEARSCHILYVGSDERSRQAEVVASLADRSVFTVSDSAGFTQMGGVANFIRGDRKIRFEINQKAATRAGLKISSRLLRIAQLAK